MAELTTADRIAVWKPVAARILPPNASDLEKATLTAELARLSLYKPEVIATIWDPWGCPDELLPFLAWALSVDIWSDEWSEIEKRREIAASPGIHRLKGAVLAIRRALDRMGLVYSISEWWEVEPPRRKGTARIFVDLGEREDIIAVREEALLRIRTSKPKSRVVDLRVGTRSIGPLGIASATITRSKIVAEPFILGDVTEQGPLGIAAGTFTRSRITANPRP